MKYRQIVGIVLKNKFYLGFFNFNGYLKITLNIADLNNAEADPLTISTHMKYDEVIY